MNWIVGYGLLAAGTVFGLFIASLLKAAARGEIVGESQLRIVAEFIGSNGSLGYQTGQRYSLIVSGNAIRPGAIAGDATHVQPCPYGSVEAFLQNWTNVEVRNV